MSTRVQFSPQCGGLVFLTVDGENAGECTGIADMVGNGAVLFQPPGKILTAARSALVDAPVINEFPTCLECEFVEYQKNAYGCGVIVFDPYTHGYYKVTERVGDAFKDGLKLKK